MTDGRIRVLVADDHAVVREGIRSVLEDDAGIVVVAEAGTAAEALTLARSHVPDVAVLDISMPGTSGIELAVELRDALPSVAVLVLSMHHDAEYVLEAVRAGARGYVVKDASPAEMRRAVLAIAAGEAFFSPQVARQLAGAVRDQARSEQEESPTERLTAREHQVLLKIADGRTNKEIAGELGISPRTVETHRESLMRKLKIHTVAGLTKFVLENGLRSGRPAPPP